MDRRNLIIVGCMFAAIAVTSVVLGRRSPHIAAGEDAAGWTSTPADTVEGVPVPEAVAEFLRNGQSWRAARAMRTFLRQNPGAGPEAVLLAARAEAGWGGWSHVRRYLEGEGWLDGVGGGEGWYWLGRALEEDDAHAEAVSAYDAFLRLPPITGDSADADRRIAARLRRGLILLRGEERQRGAELLRSVRDEVPALGEWLDLLSAESLAEVGDTARVEALVGGLDVPELSMRGRRALVRAYTAADDPRRLRARAEELRRAAESGAERAEFGLAAARAALEIGDSSGARPRLRSIVADAAGTPSARTAAELLEELGGLDRDTRLAIADVYARHGPAARAARLYRAWLAAGAGTAAERNSVRLRLGRALFAAGDFRGTIDALEPLAGEDGARGAEALYLIGRSQYRSGSESAAMRTWTRAAELHPGNTHASEGLFLVADLSHDEGEMDRAIPVYRRVAREFRGSDRAGLALMRLGGEAFRTRQWADAAAAWEQYRAAYPRGQRWLQATYWAGRAYEEAGDLERARALYRAVREREPLSYYAVVSAERLGEDFWPVPLAADPAHDSAATARVAGWMRPVDLLVQAGLHTEAELEADRRIRLAGSDRALLYALAEALNERGLTVRGVRIGLRLQSAAATPSRRLLRIVYPLPYAPMISAEAREKELDPFVVAALTRQESLFKARITSPAGARGLMQIMPETGRQLARGADIDDWDAELLYQPEINVHLGTRFLADQMRTYENVLPAVFSAYNAGPHRIDRWMQLFPEWGDEQLFTERIPFRETRDYVKILTRNIEIYRGLYE